MTLKCYICNFYDSKRMSLFRIPNRNDEYCERAGLWLKLLNEKSENVHTIRICSIHFLKKKPAKSGDILNVDWLPNQNLGRFSKNLKLIEYHFRKFKKTQTEKEKNLYQECEKADINPNIAELPAKATSQGANQNCTINANPVVGVYKNATEQVETAVATNTAYLAAQGKLIGHHFQKLKKTQTEKEKNLDYQECEKADINPNIAELPAKATAQGENQNCTINGNTVVGVYKNATEQVKPAAVATNTSYLTLKELTGEASSSVSRLSLTDLIPLKKRKIHVIEQKNLFFKEIQTDLTSDDIEYLLKYYETSVEERNQMLLKISTLVIDIDFFQGNDKKTRFYTGLTTWSLLNNLYELVKNFLPSHFNCKLTQFRMLVLTLIKLRLNLKFTDLGYRFQVDETTASRYFHRCIYILEKIFYNSKLLHWPERANLLQNVPSYFRSTFKEAITIIVDCFELFIESSCMLKASSQSFSQYKHHKTLKFLIGISITGVIMFVSVGYGGRASDKFVVNNSKFLDNLQEGDVVLADRGFLVEGEVKAKEATLILPSFVKEGNQLHPTQVQESRHIASIRIHVERVISVVREKFNICSDVALMSAVSKQNDLFNNDLYDKIIFVCCCLVNVCPSVVNNYFEM